MKFSIDALEFQKIIKILGVVARARALDTSGKIGISAEGSSVTFFVNKLTTAVIYESKEVKIQEEGKASILYSEIKNFVMSYKPWDGSIGVKVFDFSTKKSNVKISVNNHYAENKKSKGTLKLTWFNYDHLVQPDKFENLSFNLNSSVFKKITDKVLYAIDPKKDKDLIALMGMYVNLSPKESIFAGANGMVLSEYIVKLPIELEAEIILQHEFIMGLRRLVPDDLQMMWSVSDKNVIVKFDNIIYSGKLISGYNFPEYRQLFDKFNHTMVLPKNIFIESLSPMMDSLNDDDNNRVTIEIKDSLLRFYNHVADIEIKLDEEYKDIEFIIDIDGKFLFQTIDVFQDTELIMKFSEPEVGVIFDDNEQRNQKSYISPLIRR